jgi:hypothetical protein
VRGICSGGICFRAGPSKVSTRTLFVVLYSFPNVGLPLARSNVWSRPGERNVRSTLGLKSVPINRTFS